MAHKRQTSSLTYAYGYSIGAHPEDLVTRMELVVRPVLRRHPDPPLDRVRDLCPRPKSSINPQTVRVTLSVVSD
eukprot:3214776-Rhodomonas_salina.1